MQSLATSPMIKIDSLDRFNYKSQDLSDGQDLSQTFRRRVVGKTERLMRDFISHALPLQLSPDLSATGG